MNRGSIWGRVARRSTFALGGLLCGLALLGGTGQPRYVPLAQADETAPGMAPTIGEVPAPGEEEVFAPMAYFAQNCARCHGPNGSFYGANFGKALTDDKLHTVVHDMAAGPGNAPIKDRALEIEVAYHRALIAKQPFIVLTEVTEKDGIKTLHGEVSPESTIQLVVNQKQVLVSVEDAAWTAVLPRDAVIPNGVLTVTKDAVTTVLQLKVGMWSHSNI